MTVSSPFCEEFSIPEELVGLAIGTHGANIHIARSIEGVTDVSFDRELHGFKVGTSESTVRCSWY